jgi:hypothetical protein
MPHFPVLRVRNANVQQALNVIGVMEAGNVFSGVHLTVPNARGAGVTYDQFEYVTRVASYVEEYAFSPEVVMGGHAAVYFDLFSGSMVPWPIVHQAIEVTARIETTGPPELLATPFFGGAPVRLSLADVSDDADAPVELWVANQGIDCTTHENSFDFLLHYLTNRNGIPRVLTQLPPGVTDLTPFTPLMLDKGADHLKTIDYPEVFDSPCFQLESVITMRDRYRPGRGFEVETEDGTVTITSLACSNSQYP